MNFDQIQKLIKLANNNPNEHEANSAARRVCKLLENHKFVNSPDRPPIRNVSTPYGPSDWFHKWAEEKIHFYDDPFYREKKTDEETKRKYREGSWDDLGEEKKEPKKEEPNYNYKPHPKQEEFFNQGKPIDKADDWYLCDPQNRIYKNKKTNMVITELEYFNRYGTKIPKF